LTLFYLAPVPAKRELWGLDYKDRWFTIFDSLPKAHAIRELMKRFAVCFFVLALAVIVEEQARAQSRLPAGSWEQLPQGFAIALTCDKNAVTLNIKNTSDTLKQIRRSSVMILLFYTDEQGVLIQLSNGKDQKKHGDPAKDILDGMDPPDSRGPMTFPPRMEDWYQLGVEITPEDRSLIRVHPVVCRIEFYDLITNTKFHLESSPKRLVDNG
jgi:hypothetical protein